MNTKQHHIYILIDPTNGGVKYVGQSTNLSSRYISHVHGGNSNEFVKTWIKSLKPKKLKPIMVVVNTYHNYRDALAAERKLISSLSEKYYLLNLVNNPNQNNLKDEQNILRSQRERRSYEPICCNM